MRTCSDGIRCAEAIETEYLFRKKVSTENEDPVKYNVFVVTGALFSFCMMILLDTNPSWI